MNAYQSWFVGRDMRGFKRRFKDYGTVARMRTKPGKEADLLAMNEEGASDVPGMVFQHVYRLDGAENEYILVVGFKDKDVYVANANSPEMHESYLAYRELLETDTEWNDGEVIYSSGL